MEQVWFAGVHSDVGGYHPKRGLANISLHWMLERAEAEGMEVDQRRLRRARYKPDPHGESQESYTGLWLIRGQHVRDIPAESKVHPQRLGAQGQRSNRYSPSNLPDRNRVQTVV